MKKFNYSTTEGILLDKVDTINYIVWKINDLKLRGYSDEFICDFILFDESIVGDSEELVYFVKQVLNKRV